MVKKTSLKVIKLLLVLLVLPEGLNNLSPVQAQENTIPSCWADLNQDGVISIFDLAIVGHLYGTTDLKADINGDGKVDIFDLVLMAQYYNQPVDDVPGIEFTHVPAYGSFENLRGRVMCITSADYSVAVYIYVSGWWTKPTFAQPLTNIQSDSRWATDITTGGTDQLATKIAAFLIPNDYTPPSRSGQQELPDDLFANAVAHIVEDREAVFRTIEFSGYTWQVKASETRAGPGPNYFSDREEDVWVDEIGRLHLNIVFKNNRWYSTEVFTVRSFGYGLYTFTLASRVDQLDKNVVLGLFTWDDTSPEYNYREIDIEFSRWGEETGANSQFVIQPWTHPGNRHRFNMNLQENYSTHHFDWQADRLQFSSYQGRQSSPNPGHEIESWLYTGADIPSEGKGNARINLWLLNGDPPSNGQKVEVIIDAFQFSP